MNIVKGRIGSCAALAAALLLAACQQQQQDLSDPDLSTREPATLAGQPSESLAFDPLAECYQKSRTRIEVGDCLSGMLDAADRVLARTNASLAQQMRELDEITTARYDAESHFRRAEIAFARFVEQNCRWRAAMMAGGTGAGDTYKACLVEMKVGRAADLQGAL